MKNNTFKDLNLSRFSGNLCFSSFHGVPIVNRTNVGLVRSRRARKKIQSLFFFFRANCADIQKNGRSLKRYRVTFDYAKEKDTDIAKLQLQKCANAHADVREKKKKPQVVGHFIYIYLSLSHTQAKCVLTSSSRERLIDFSRIIIFFLIFFSLALSQVSIRESLRVYLSVSINAFR